MENQYFTTWEIIKFFKWFLKNEKLNLKIKWSINSSFANHWSRSTQYYILFSKRVRNFDVCQNFEVLSFRSFNLSEPWAVDTSTVSNFRLSINRPFGFSMLFRISMLLAIDILNFESAFYDNWLVNELVVRTIRFKDIDLCDKWYLDCAFA